MYTVSYEPLYTVSYERGTERFRQGTRSSSPLLLLSLLICYSHGGVRLFIQTSTCLTQSTSGPYVVQIWSRKVRKSEPKKPSNSTEWTPRENLNTEPSRVDEPQRAFERKGEGERGGGGGVTVLVRTAQVHFFFLLFITLKRRVE